jgi:hypothetical protein
VDAGHRDSAFDRARRQPAPSRARGLSPDGVVPPGQAQPGVAPRPPALSWRNFFLAADRFLKLWEEHGSRTLRRLAIRKAERWILERTRYSDGLGAIYPPMMYVIMALDVFGYAREHPDRSRPSASSTACMTDDGERFFFQPCFSPVWDTAIAASRSEAGPRPGTALARRRLAAHQGSAPQRRLGGEAARRRAGRLVLRVRQRVLSRH